VRFLALIVGLLACSSVIGQTTEPVPVLLELFTSEGCSSCPPADALLEKLDRTQPVRGARLIVLSEHVDYWNALGWKDPFSSAQFTARQSDYAAKIGGSSNVYTPELVVDGRQGVVGSDEGGVSAAIARAATRRKLPLTIADASRTRTAIVFRVDGSATDRAAELYVAVAYDSARTRVLAGENAGRTLMHVAVVRDLVRVGTFSAGDKVSKDVALQAGDYGTNKLRLVAFLEDERTGAVLELAQQAL
jgi:hypothetical protein